MKFLFNSYKLASLFSSVGTIYYEFVLAILLFKNSELFNYSYLKSYFNNYEVDCKFILLKYFCIMFTYFCVFLLIIIF